jgi:hypothetical protein
MYINLYADIIDGGSNYPENQVIKSLKHPAARLFQHDR